jgi:hypothetical protein
VKNVTYLFGAGASHGALPIATELGIDMFTIIDTFEGYNREKVLNSELTIKNPFNNGTTEYLAYDLRYFGSQAMQFGTLDGYAAKLYHNKDFNQLHRLKMTLSIYLVICQELNRSKLGGNIQRSITKIDQRYLKLIKSCLDLDITNSIRDNIHFLTWNYDLQLQHTLMTYFAGVSDIEELNRGAFKFTPSQIQFPVLTSKSKICHINGFCGFYTTEAQNYVSYLDRAKASNITEKVKSMAYISDSASKGSINFNNAINFAWENNQYSTQAVSRAKEIMEITDTLVVIGYSFPDDNIEIDRNLISHAIGAGKMTRIIIQNPSLEEDEISEKLNIKREIIETRKEVNEFLSPKIIQ